MLSRAPGKSARVFPELFGKISDGFDHFDFSLRAPNAKLSAGRRHRRLPSLVVHAGCRGALCAFAISDSGL